MKKKNSGFTLVELLVTIVVLGIITGFSIPLIRNIRESQIKKQYETYRTSLSYASKVYVDSFSEDLFGHDEIACATVSYNQLKSKNLIKDIPIDGVSCASNDTYVRIVKFEGQYSYLPKITCGKPQADGTISKDVEIPEGDINSNLCGLNVPTKIDIKFHPESSHTPNVRRKNITVDFTSPTGIHSDPIIYWAFSDKADFSTIIGDWKQLDLDIPSKKKQKALILQGNTISLSKEFITPKNYSGKLYLVLKIDRLQDLGGKNWTTTDTDIVSGGYYAVDNEPPKLNDSEIKYSKPVHRRVTPTLNFKATDNLTSESNLRMCISEDTETDNCSKNINDIKKKQNGWVTYNKSKVLPVMNNASNGENHNIFISIGDQAGNYVSQQFVYYQSPVDYSITYNLDGGSHGASHPSRVDFDEEFTVSYPSKKITTIFVNNVSGCSVDYSASTVSGSGKAVNYTFNGWNITGMDTSTHTFGSRTSTKIKEDNVKETKFKGLRHTSNGVVFSATWIPPTIKLPTATKTGHTCVWKSNGIADRASGGNYKPAEVGGATSRTFTTSCSTNVYTVTLNKQSGSGGTTTIYEKYNTGWYSNSGATSSISSITKPSRTGYTFGGYYTATNGGGTQIINANGAILSGKTKTFTANGTLYAKWTPKVLTITLNKQSGSGGTSTIYEKYNTGWYSNSGATSSISSITKPSRTGYTFGGYYTATNGGGTQIINANGAILSGKTTTFSANGTLYAKWIPKVLTITLNKQSGSGGTSTIYEKYNTGWYSNSGATSSISSITKPSRTGYTFGGYYTATNGGGTQIINANGAILSGKTKTFTANGTLYAKWTPKVLTITLNKQSGSGGTTTIYEKYNTGWYSNSGATSSISSITKPSRTGYTFGGYYTATNGGGTQIINANGAILSGKTKTFTANGTLYAKWTPKVLTITLNKQSGSGGTSTIYEKYNTGWYSNSGATSSISSITKPSRTGYTFGGYYTATNGGGTQIINANGAILSGKTKTFTANGTLYAKWTPKVLTITLNKQSGSGGTSTIYEKYNTGWYSNSGATSSISSITKPSRTGYTFGGYYTATNGGGTQIINANGAILSGKTKTFTANGTLYAKWTPKVLTITLNKQSGSGGTSTIYEKYNTGWYSNSGATSSISSITKPSRTGYTFGGYYTATNGGGTQIINANGAILSGKTKTFTANGTLYAKWTPKVLTITLNKQSGSGGTSTIYEKYNTGWYSNSGATSSISSITKPSRTGYTFGGYYTATNGGGTQIINANGAILSGKTKTFTANGTLYAKWTPKVLTITLNKQSGSGGTSTIYEKYNTGWYSNSGATSSISSITKPSRTGYTFGGYYTATNGGGTQIINANGAILSGKTKTFTANGTLYAKWTPKVLTITLNKQSGSGGTSTIYEKYNTGWYSNSGATASISSITKPSRTGYTFGGYYTATNGGGTQIINANGAILSGKTTTFSANGTLYAKWIPKVLTITLNKQSGSGGTATIYEKYNTGWYSNSGATSAISSITKPSRTGYTFGGYYTGTGGSGTQVINANGTILSGKTTTFSANGTLYAKWIPKVLTITLNKQSGSGGTATIYEKYNTGWYSNSGATSAISSITKPSRTGYTFGGYYTGTGGSGTQVINANGTILSGKTTTFSANGTLYAKWTPNTFTVAYNKNGGTSGSTTSHTCTYDATCTARANGFAKTGYSFNGWKKGNAGSTVAAGASIKNAATSGTVTYYAQWKANTFTVAYNANGGSGTTASHTCTYDGTCTTRANGFSKTGYRFTGWKKGNAGGLIAAGASIKNAATSGTVTYYAQWQVSCDSSRPYWNGKACYANLQAALNGTAANGTIQLMTNTSDSSTPTSTKAGMKLVLNGHTLTKTSQPISVTGGSLTITNGTITANIKTTLKITGGTVNINGSSSTIVIKNTRVISSHDESCQTIYLKGATLNMSGANANIQAGSASNGYARTVLIDSGTFNMTGGKIVVTAKVSGKYGPVGVNVHGRFTMSGGSITASTISDGYAVSANKNGKVNITGGSVTTTGRGKNEGIGAVVNTEHASNSCVFIGSGATISCTSSRYCVAGHKTTIRIQSGATISTSNVKTAKENTKTSSSTC